MNYKIKKKHLILSLAATIAALPLVVVVLNIFGTHYQYRINLYGYHQVAQGVTGKSETIQITLPDQEQTTTEQLSKDLNSASIEIKQKLLDAQLQQPTDQMLLVLAPDTSHKFNLHVIYDAYGVRTKTLLGQGSGSIRPNTPDFISEASQIKNEEIMKIVTDTLNQHLQDKYNATLILNDKNEIADLIN